MELYSLRGAIESALNNSSSLQATVRQYIAEQKDLGDGGESIATAIAEVISELRNEMERKLEGDEAKRVNNVFNDVSRICKEALGFAIKCKTRKPLFVYLACKVEPKVEVDPEPMLEDEIDAEVPFEPSTLEKLQALVDSDGLKEVASAMASILKANKSPSTEV